VSFKFIATKASNAFKVEIVKNVRSYPFPQIHSQFRSEAEFTLKREKNLVGMEPGVLRPTLQCLDYLATE